MRASLSRIGLGLGLVLGACATPTSPHFTSVANHLDQGGKVFLYTDIEGDLPAGAEYLDKLLARLGKVSPELHLERINANRLLGQLGLDTLQAFGLSSTQEGAVFHNKAFLKHQGPRRGLLLLTGEAPRPLEITRQAPANADVVFESDLRIKTLVDLFEGIVKDTLGPDANEVLEFLDEKTPAGSLTVRQLIDQLDTRIMGILRVDIPRDFVLSKHSQGKPMTLDLLVAADRFAVLFDAADRLLRLIPSIKRSTEGDWQYLEMAIPVPQISGLAPVLAKNGKTGRVLLASNRGVVKEFLGAPATGTKLGDTPEFKVATAGFAPQANGFSYVSGAFLPKVVQLARALGQTDREVREALDLIVDLLPTEGMTFASQQVNLPDGLSYISNTPYSYKSALFAPLLAAPVAAGIAAAVAIPAYTRYERNASARHGSRIRNMEKIHNGLEDCLKAVTTLEQRRVGQTGRPKSKTKTMATPAPLSLPATLPVVCPNPRSASTDPNLGDYRALGWRIGDARELCFQYQRTTADRKGAPAAFRCHAWSDPGDGPTTHWSAQGTWSVAQGAWETQGPEIDED